MGCPAQERPRKLCQSIVQPIVSAAEKGSSHHPYIFLKSYRIYTIDLALEKMVLDLQISPKAMGEQRVQKATEKLPIELIYHKPLQVPPGLPQGPLPGQPRESIKATSESRHEADPEEKGQRPPRGKAKSI